MKREILSAAAAAAMGIVALAIATAAAPPPKAGVRGAPSLADSTLGLSRASVFATPVPNRVEPEASSPGDRPRRARAYPGAPPQVPHDVSDFVPITRAENQCFDCHSKASAADNGVVPLPSSHYTDLRNNPGKVRDTLAGARYLCTSCHATGSDARPLVGIGFKR